VVRSSIALRRPVVCWVTCGVTARARQPAEETFSKIGLAFSFAVTELEHAEWLIANDGDAEAGPMLADATHTFERLQARPWLDRAMQSAPTAVVVS
jgi:hypothetical protein